MIIGVAGATGGGKSTAADHLVAAHGFALVSFAEPLKQEVARTLRRTLIAYLRTAHPGLRMHDDAGGMTATGWDRHIRCLLWERRDEFARALLQEWGTELRRAEDPAYWVKQWEYRLAAVPAGQDVVVPDVRFENEAEAILRAGGRLVKIHRPGHGGDTHGSERNLDGWRNWSSVFTNAGTIEDLREWISLCVSVWREELCKAPASPS